MLIVPLLAACGPNLAVVGNEELPASVSYARTVEFRAGTTMGPAPTVNVTATPSLPHMVGRELWSVADVRFAPAVVVEPIDAGTTQPVDAGAVEPIDAGVPEPVDAGLAPPETDGGLRGLDVSVHLALGLPDGSGVGQAARWLLVRPQYVTSYNSLRKVPNWSSWKLDATDFGSASRATSFKTDPLLAASVAQANDADYRNSGFDRGHLCPSADRTFTDADNDATFFLTNVVPQTHASNAGPWLDLEDESRQLATTGKRMVIIAGPIFGATQQAIGTGVDVPLSMFKVVVVMDGPASPQSVTSSTKVYAAIIPNAAVISGSWRQWQVTARTVEQLTGLDFLSDLPRSTQDLLETRLDP